MSQINPSSSSSVVNQITTDQKLMEFLPSSDDQLNAFSPPHLLTSRRLTSIMDRGILSREAMNEQNLTYQGGHDLGTNNVVYLNLVTKEAGISRAIFNAADGIFGVGTERANDYEWIQSICDQGAIDNIFQQKLVEMQIPPLLHALVREKSLQEHLESNLKFLEELQDRANNLAVLVLNIPPKATDALNDPSGCHDAVRPNVPAADIFSIVISQDLKDTAEIANIVFNNIKPVSFVPLKKQEITYTYEKPSPLGPMQKTSFKVTIEAPDFEGPLRDIYRTHFFPQRQPMYLHVTRL